MSSFTTLVNVDADTAPKLVQIIAGLLEGNNSNIFLTKCNALVENTKTAELIDEILEKRDILFSLEKDKDIEAIFQALVSIIFTLEENIDSVPIIKKIMDIITSSIEKPLLRLKVLVNIFNLTFVITSKYDAIISIFKYAIETKQTNFVSSYHNRIDGWVKSWNLTIEQKRQLYLLVSSSLGKSGHTSLCLNFQIRYFETFADGQFPADVLPLAINTVVSAIKSHIDAFNDRNTIIECVSFKNQKGNSGTLVELLRIICRGSLDDYDKYAATNKALMNEHAIDVNEIGSNMKLLSLCSLAVQQNVIPYTTISKALKIDVADVDNWIVEAVSLNLFEGSMDQNSQVLNVSRCVHRSFDKEDWKKVQSKLSSLRKNVQDVVNSISKHTAL
jgi:translation initiation factor 3 subunit M